MTTADTAELFAGPGGWDEGIRSLGVEPEGLEWAADAVATASAAGHTRRLVDVATVDPLEYLGVTGLIGSPPCPGFSMSGARRGLLDAKLLLAAVPYMADRDVRAELHEHMTDDRSVLALEPLRWALALRPAWTAWEQVPTVLPIWQACARALEAVGYSTATGVVSSERYGVPQVRRRAILVARSPELTRTLGPAALPAPTHSAYHARTPERLDPGVRPWVSMAEGLGWTRGHVGEPWAFAHRRPAPTITGGGTATGGAEPIAKWVERYVPRGTRRITPVEAGLLQTFPADYPWTGNQGQRYRQAGDAVPPRLARAIVAEVAGLAAELEAAA